MGDHDRGASGPGSVLLDLGDGVGALIVDTGPEELGREIEVGPVPDAGAPRTHAAVRERHLPGGVRYAAVYPALPAGRYVIWRDATRSAGTVRVAGGRVSRWRLPAGSLSGP